jgi:hypothetical protein
MSAKRWLLLLSLPVLLLLAMPVWAQADELTQAVELSDIYTVSVPADWEVEEDEEMGGFVLLGDGVGALVFEPTQIAAIADVKEDDPLVDKLIDLYRQLASSRARRSEIEEIALGEYPAASYGYVEDEYEGLFIVVDYGDEQFGVLDFYTSVGDLDDQLDLAMAIAETFRPAEGAIDPKTGLPFGTAPVTTTISTESPPASEPCLVSTTSADTVQLHVGPGLNRAVVAFLPANNEFDVTGSFTTDDGSEWFQLDKNEVAPSSAASEVRVARENVDESGDCDAVAGTSAPPIVPIISNPPPQPTTAPGETAAPVEAGLVPAEGDWTFTLDTTLLASCEGTETVRFNTQEVIGDEPLSQIFRLRVSNGGASITFGGDVYILTSPGNYYGTYTFEDGTNAQIRLQVVSTTFMSGSLVGNATVDGIPCSATVAIRLTHN